MDALTRGTEVKLNPDSVPPNVIDNIHLVGIITDITENYYQVVWQGHDRKTYFKKEDIIELNPKPKKEETEENV